MSLGVLLGTSGAFAPVPAWAGEQAISQVAAGEDVEDVNDPLEPINRLIFDFNEIFQKLILRPATGMYQHLVPPPIREAIGNVIKNLSTPVVLANDILQGEGERAWQTTQRFVVNTTLGVGGIMDPAEEMGIPRHKEDFGQTLAVWGVGEGFYVVLPLYGPSNPRDAVGKLLVDSYFDPLGLYLSNTDQDSAIYARMGVGAADEYGGVMDELEQIKKTSVDFYAAVRSMYRQKRKSEIKNGEEINLPPIPDLGAHLDHFGSDPQSGSVSAARAIARDGQLSQGVQPRDPAASN